MQYEAHAQVIETIGKELLIDAFKEFVKHEQEAAATARFSAAGGAGAEAAAGAGDGAEGAGGEGTGDGTDAGSAGDRAEGAGAKGAGEEGAGACDSGGGEVEVVRSGGGDAVASSESATGLITRFMDKFRIQYFLKRGLMPPPYYDDADENAIDLINRVLVAKMMKRAVKNGD